VNAIPDLYDDALLYDLIHHDYRDDLEFYRRLAHAADGPVLELGAGSGRVSHALARSGVTVVAVEPALAMRERAEAAAAALGLDERVQVVAADMRSLALSERYPLIIAPFNGLMHLASLDDQDAALAGVVRHLAPGGLFACDLYVPRFLPDDQPRLESIRLPDGQLADLWTVQQHDPLRQRIVTEHRLDALDEHGRVQRRRARLEQRYFSRFEFERALRSAGLGDLRVYGDFARGPVTASTHQWVFVARVSSEQRSPPPGPPPA
jgi:SAM-dependent methyltransferase